MGLRHANKYSLLIRNSNLTGHPVLLSIISINPVIRKWQPTAVFFPGEFQGQRSLAGYSPRSHKESDTTEWLTHARLPRWLSAKESTFHGTDAGLIPGSGRSPRGGNVTCSGTLARRILQTEGPGRLQSMGLQRVRHKWATEHTTL